MTMRPQQYLAIIISAAATTAFCVRNAQQAAASPLTTGIATNLVALTMGADDKKANEQTVFYQQTVEDAKNAGSFTVDTQLSDREKDSVYLRNLQGLLESFSGTTQKFLKEKPNAVGAFIHNTRTATNNGTAITNGARQVGITKVLGVDLDKLTQGGNNINTITYVGEQLTRGLKDKPADREKFVKSTIIPGALENIFNRYDEPNNKARSYGLQYLLLSQYLIDHKDLFNDQVNVTAVINSGYNKNNKSISSLDFMRGIYLLADALNTYMNTSNNWGDFKQKYTQFSAANDVFMQNMRPFAGIGLKELEAKLATMPDAQPLPKLQTPPKLNLPGLTPQQ